MIKHLICVDELTNEVAFALEVDHPDDGPPRFVIPVPDGKRFVEVDQPFVRHSESSTTLPFLIDGVVTWIETADLDDQRTQKNVEINAAWLRADSTIFTYAGEQVGAEPDDVVRLNAINGFISLMGAMPPDWPGVWKTKANTYIPLPNIDAWKPFYTAFVLKGVTNYAAAQSLKARIAAATTAAEIAAIHWPE